MVNDAFISKNDKKVVKIAGLSSCVYFYMLQGESFIKSGKLIVE